MAEADALEAGVYYADEINLKERESAIHDAETERAEVSLALKRLDEGTLIAGEEISFVPTAEGDSSTDRDQDEKPMMSVDGRIYEALLADELEGARRISVLAHSEAQEEPEDAFTVCRSQSVATLVAMGRGRTFRSEKGVYFVNSVEAASDDPDNQAPKWVADAYRLEEHTTGTSLSVSESAIVATKNSVDVSDAAVVFADRKPISATAAEHWVRRVPTDDRDTSAKLALDRAESAQVIGYSHPDSATDALSAIVEIEEELYGKQD
jgi:hypothetical protein